MIDLSKKKFVFFLAVFFVTITLTRIITRNTGFPSSFFDSTLAVLFFDFGLFAIIFFMAAFLLEKMGLFKDKNKDPE